jgi:hypothetical protein
MGCAALRQVSQLVTNLAKRYIVGLQRTIPMLLHGSEQVMFERLDCVYVVIMYVFAPLRLVVDESDEERSVIPG